MLLRLLKVDFYKMLKSNTFLIVGATLVTFTGLLAWIFAWLASREKGAPINILDGMLISFNSLTGLVCLSIVAANFICSEFSNGTIKNVVSKGYARELIYLSKLVMSFVAAVIYMICMLVTYLIVSVIFLRGSDVKLFGLSPHFISCFFILLLYVVAVIAISMLFAILFKKSWTSVLLFIFVPTILELVQMVTKFKIMEYLLTSNMSLLNQTISGVPNNNLLRVILVPIVYSLVTFFAGFYIFKKRDI